MNKESLQILLDYNYATHRKVWPCIESLTEAQFTQEFEYSIGSVRNHVVHTMSAEWAWLCRMNGQSVDSLFANEDYPAAASVRAKWDEIENNIRAYLDGLSQNQLEENINYSGLKGGSFWNSRWEMFTQIIIHGTDHRAQILTLLHQLGTRTVAQDWMFYLRDKAG